MISNERTIMKPVWLLDIDGVINAVTRKTPKTWPENDWIKIKIASFPFNVSKSVLNFIHEVYESNLVDIKWHTTWQHDANDKVGLALDLPKFEVFHAPEYLEHEPWAHIYKKCTWWKLPSVNKLLETGCSIIWTDDDICLNTYDSDYINPKDKLYTNSLLIKPQTNLGLTPKHVTQIREYLELI